MLTTVPGASRSYLGGVISYATRLKSELAGVDEATLVEVGPVASRTAEEMAVGVARRCRADWGIATTGVAGPDPQNGHPVGQVFVAVARPAESRVQVRELAAAGDRAAIRRHATLGALQLLAELLGMPNGPLGVETLGET